MEDPKFTKLSLSAEETDMLCSLYGIKDHGELFAWGVKLIYDLTRAQQHGWHTTLLKSKYTENGLEFNPDYFYAAFRMENLAPRDGQFCRIDPENLEEKLKKPTFNE